MTFDNVFANYIKLYVKNDNGEIAVSSIWDDVKAYSSIEAKSAYMEMPFGEGFGNFYTTSDGTLIMSYNSIDEEYTGPQGDYAPRDFYINKSTDGGYTWGEHKSIMKQTERESSIMAPMMFRLSDGDLGMAYISEWHDDPNTSVDPNFGDGVKATMKFVRSNDDGSTWSEPIVITDNPAGYTINSNGNRVTVLENGRILVPVSFSINGNETGCDRSVTYVWRSDDDGKTWTRSEDFLSLPNAALEPIIAVGRDGMLVMTVRTRYVGKFYSAVSTDNGETWSQLEEVENMVSPSSTNTVLRIPATGDIALAWNNVFSLENTPRTPMSLAVTADNGKTYGNVRNLMQSTTYCMWPVLDFYGRAMFTQVELQRATAVMTVHIRDVAELYTPALGGRTVADLPKAETPAAVYDRSNGILSGVSDTMKYSTDGGRTWYFAGGTTVEIDPDAVDSEYGIDVMDIGTSDKAPSEVQNISDDKIVDIVVNDDTATATVKLAAEKTAYVIFAAYAEDGALLSADIGRHTLAGGESKISAKQDFSVAGAKRVSVFVWNDTAFMKPICKGKTVDVK